MTAVLKNARRLAEDARLLLSLQRYPTAAALAVLAIEEVGKFGHYRDLSFAQSDQDVARIWARSRTHREKNFLWIFPTLVDQAKEDVDLVKLTMPNPEHAKLIDFVKHSAIYCECYDGGEWLLPETEVDPEFARHLVRTAGELARTRVITEREVELWTIHCHPSKLYSPQALRDALRDWKTAMQAEAPLSDPAATLV